MDYYRFCDSLNVHSFFKCLIFHPGFRIAVISRIIAYLRFRKHFKYLSYPLILFHTFLKEFSGICISYSMVVGEGFYIPHPGGIVVNQNSIIGNNCYLSHNVTIGKVHTGDKSGVPTIGDRVYLGPGSVILGNIKIGDDAAVAANSVVISDVPSGVFVAGSPAKIVRQISSSDLLGKVSISD